MSDWQDATDPVQPVREREKRKLAGSNAQKKAAQLARLKNGSLNDGGVVPSFYVFNDFDEGR